MTTGRINQVTRPHACKGPGNSPRAEPSETQRNTVEIQFLALQRSKDRQTNNKFLPPGNVRTLARETSARTRETTRRNRERTDLALEALSSARLLSTLAPGYRRGKLHSGSRRPEHSTAKHQKFCRPITRTANRSAKGQSETSPSQLLFPLHKTKHPSPSLAHVLTSENKTVNKSKLDPILSNGEKFLVKPNI